MGWQAVYIMSDEGERKNVLRRNLLRGIGSGSLGVSTVAAVEVVGASGGDDTVRIPTVKRGDTVVKSKEVPESWYNHTQDSKNAREKLTEEHLDDSGVESIYSARWSEQFDGKNGLLIKAEINPDTYEDSLPDSKDGIPVRTTAAPDLQFGNCCHHDDYDPVHGGVAVQTPDDVGSAGFCVTDSDGNERLLTANHLWGTCQDNGGRLLKQHTDAFGEVDECDTDTDYALVRSTSSDGIDNKVYLNGSLKRVSGYVPPEGLQELVSSNETCYSTGATTCTTQGTIKGEGLDSPGYQCVDYGGSGVKAEIVAGEGDSGGPIFATKMIDGKKYATIIAHCSLFSSDGSVGCHWGSGEKGSPIYGTAFHHLRNDHELNLCQS
jgi:hypothetical protein